jgi:AraC-like DNA-binding protein
MSQPEQAWTTRRTPPGKALSYWKDVICQNLLNMNIASKDESGFCGHIAKYSFGPLKANFISVSEQRVWRAGTAQMRSSDGVFHLIQVRKGVQLAEHQGRSLTVEQGSCLLLDCRASFDLSFPQGVDALVFEIRRDWLQGWLPAPEAAAACIIDGTSSWGATLSSALNNLTPTSIAQLELSPTVVAEQIAVLLALAGVPRGPALTTHKRSLLRRVSEILRERCQEPELDPAAVAAALGFSRRYVHVLLASAGTTFSDELYSARLSRAERLLSDMRYDDLGVAEVAWSCGFNEPSHFTRRFRARYGMPPTAYRHQRN